MSRLAGKTAVVTGGGSGIGRGLVLALAERGCKVVVADIELAQAEAVAGEARAAGVDALAVHCDVTRLASVEALAEAAWERFGSVQLLFNNAGVAASSTSLLTASAEELQWVLSVNLVGVWNGCSVFMKRFLASDEPCQIINTASEHALGVPHAGQGFYTASKHAVLGLSDVLRLELAGRVGVSVFCPGLVQSNLWDAQRNRPPELGFIAVPDEVKAIGKAVVERGMDALEVGRRAVTGVEQGEFIIVSHPVSRFCAERRWQEISAAFETQAPYQPGCEQYDVNAVLNAVVQEAHAARP